MFVEKNYTYLWQPVDKSPFSLAVVKSTDQKSLRYKNTQTGIQVCIDIGIF